MTDSNIKAVTKKRTRDLPGIISRSIDVGDDNGLIRAMKTYSSNQLEDPFQQDYGLSGDGNSIIATPYKFESLLKLQNENNTLKQCVEAMVTNIDGFGHRLDYIGPQGEEDSEEALKEKVRIEELLEQPNFDYSFMELRKKLRYDYENLGNMFMELGRDGLNNISMIYHLPASTMRITSLDKEETEVERTISRRGEYVKIKTFKKFRRFVQKHPNSNLKIYFKEYGDPRAIDPRTGKVNPNLPLEEQATEVIFSSIYTPGHIYGLPRYINQLPSILGSREAELTNLQFFKDNAIPAMALLIGGGVLTDETINNLEQKFGNFTGREAVHRLVIIEALGDVDGASDDGKVPTPKVELKPLINERQSDELFQEYDDNNRKKIQSSFRLPDILIGRSDDYNRATSEAAMAMAESQVFNPERQKMDDIVNSKILSIEGIPPKFWKYRSNPPRIGNPEAVVDTLDVLDRMGGATPNIAIDLINEYFGLSIPRRVEDWGDYPFEIVKSLVSRQEIAEFEKLIQDLPQGNDSDLTEEETNPTEDLEEQEQPGQDQKTIIVGIRGQ